MDSTMKLFRKTIEVPSTSGTDIVDLTREVLAAVKESSIGDGQVLVFVPGSTGSVTTIEYESGVIQDLKEAIERLLPEGINYLHDKKWGDGNGYSHVRAALMKPSLTIPLVEGKPLLGTWQQVVLLDFDNRPRRRKVLLQVMGV